MPRKLRREVGPKGRRSPIFHWNRDEQITNAIEADKVAKVKDLPEVAVDEIAPPLTAEERKEFGL